MVLDDNWSDDEPTVYFVEISEFEEKVLRGDMDKGVTAEEWIKSDKPCPACGRPYKESRCEQCSNPHGCAYCHLQRHVSNG